MSKADTAQISAKKDLVPNFEPPWGVNVQLVPTRVPVPRARRVVMRLKISSHCNLKTAEIA